MAGIDTANLILWKRDWSGGGDFLKEIPPFFNIDEIDEEGMRRKTGEKFVTGRLSNLYVDVTPSRVIVRNSLCIYHLGNNINGMTRSDTEQAVERLSDALHVPMKLANVSRIDHGANLIMENAPKFYYPFLGYLKGFKRMEQGDEGLLYKNRGKTREFALYDKIAKAKTDKVEIPELYRGKNLLRLEYRARGLTKKDRRELGVERIRGETLYNEKFHIWANDNWRKIYRAIEKKDTRQIDFNDMKTVREYYKSFAAQWLKENGGLAAFVELQETRMKQGVITPKQKMDLIKMAKDAMEYEGKISYIDGAVEELERKVKAEIKFYR